MHTGADKPSRSYIPACSTASTVCFEYPPERYAGSTFGSASVEVTVLDGKTADACHNSGGGVDTADDKIDPTSPTRLIDRIRFFHQKGGGAAAGHELEFDRYRGFDKSTCYVLSTRISYTGGKAISERQFTDKDHANVIAQLNRIIDSFHALNR